MWLDCSTEGGTGRVVFLYGLEWGSCTEGVTAGPGDWELEQDKALVAALREGLAAGPEWEIDWGQLVPGP